MTFGEHLSQIPPTDVEVIVLSHLLNVLSVDDTFVYVSFHLFLPPSLDHPACLLCRKLPKGFVVFCVQKNFQSITLSHFHHCIPQSLHTVRPVIIASGRESFSSPPSSHVSANIPEANTMEKRSSLCQNMAAFFRLNLLRKKSGGDNNVTFSNDCLS